MTEREKYLFDVQGFLLVKNFLTPEEVARLNEAFDANQEKRGEDGNSNTGGSPALAGERKRGIFTGMLTWEHPWCEPFRELLAHPKAIPYLNAMLGRGWSGIHWARWSRACLSEASEPSTSFIMENTAGRPRNCPRKIRSPRGRG